MEIKLGVFAVPDATDPSTTVEQLLAADRSGLDVVEHYRVSGARPGPAPAHRIGIWVGAYGPRMLRLTGRLGDGWNPASDGASSRPTMRCGCREWSTRRRARRAASLGEDVAPRVRELVG